MILVEIFKFGMENYLGQVVLYFNISPRMHK